ncbi:NDP-hexose 2,3-dehydratase family protein [Curtobacterium sp. MCPF17_021]|uniref:NDP-hexose 2,3-dehydratase family protein n=1 Tax=Curtobacterium sp. MCPF17_021 TaxID=2175639 RepID=UPI0015E87784|nr:NDP-hexose 2,3-dehydratase family protein [Curtobacterium sp. MCPF17_021]WIE83457.1 NDP-hexose 2,3-dehydratase family protein [Curtobacterium sp. MCPF17_021]
MAANACAVGYTPDRCSSVEAVLDWLDDAAHWGPLHVMPVPVQQLRDWSMSGSTGDLAHDRGAFFSITGIEVADGDDILWQQPIIDQPEIGILGFIARQGPTGYELLTQAKIEPGNPHGVQIAPTVQATESNFTRRHGGLPTPFLEHFDGSRPSRVLVDTLQSEQGGRFLGKRNRNVVVECNEEVDRPRTHRWVPIEVLLECVRLTEVVNMDARSVLVTFAAAERLRMCDEAHRSVGEPPSGSLPTRGSNGDFTVRRLPLKELTDWSFFDDCIRHRTGRYFRVIGVHVEGVSREVRSWEQPMLHAPVGGLVILVVRRFGGTWEALVQDKWEAGNRRGRALAPTVQRGAQDSSAKTAQDMLCEWVAAQTCAVISDRLLAEEGGRFFRQENRYRVLEVWDDPPATNSHHWTRLDDLFRAMVNGEDVNIEARSALLCFLASRRAEETQ